MSPAHALDREVLVQRADERVVRLEDDAVVGDLGDRAAGGEREQPRAAPAAHAAVAPRRDARARRGVRVCVAKPSATIATHGVEVVARRARDTATRGAPARRARPRRSRGRRSRRRSAARARRAARRATTMRSSSPRRTARSSAAHSTRSSRDTGNSRPFGVPAIGVARAADALQERGDAMRRSDLADEIDVADVDAELERRRGDERLQLAGLQPRSRRRAASPSRGCRDARSPRRRRAAR